MFHFVLWKWRQAGFREIYNSDFVNIMVRMIVRNLPGAKFRIVCVTDEPHGIDYPCETRPLWTDHDNLANATGRHLPSCYRRLKLFDRDTQEMLGIPVGDRIISIDLDTIILAPINDVLNRIIASKCAFAGWGVRGTYHQTVFNGSFWTFNAGDHLQHVWNDFDPIVSPRYCMSKGFLGSDQAWLSLQFAARKDSLAIRFPDFASYPREVRRQRLVDRRSVIVFFHGSRKPWHPMEIRQEPWITKHWR